MLWWDSLCDDAFHSLLSPYEKDDLDVSAEPLDRYMRVRMWVFDGGAFLRIVIFEVRRVCVVLASCCFGIAEQSSLPW